MMENTQFSWEVWNQIPPKLKSSALQMSEKEVAWERDDALLVIKAFKETDIAVEGIEFFFFVSTDEPLQATTNIFGISRNDGEAWADYVSRSCSSADAFVRETFSRESERYEGKPIFNIWAFASDYS